MRSIPEWIGKTDDSPAPPRVRARVFIRHNGLCHISGRKIRPGEAWELEHLIPLCNGGRNVESNLAPALVEPHKTKTRADRAVKAKDDRVRKRHIGIKKQSRFACSRNSRWKKKIDGSVVER